MSLGLNKTKRRIASIQSTKKITKAMEMVATVKLKRFRDAYENDLAYQNRLLSLMSAASAYDKDSDPSSHYGKENEGDLPTLYLVLTSNLGLCASYNANIFKYVDGIANPEKDIIAPIGEKGRSHYAHDERYRHVDESFLRLGDNLDSRLTVEAGMTLKSYFNEKKCKKIVLVYTRYVNSLSFVADEIPVLPLTLEYEKKEYESYSPPIFEPSPREMIHLLLPRYLGALLYGKIAESSLSEQASRRTAMENATDNADELLEELTIEYNKARQGAITQEIVEVVSGALGQ